MVRNAWPVMTAFMLLLAATSVWAVEPKENARVRYRSGQNHYDLNEFREALLDFKEAYRLFADPVFLFNIGQCERQLGNADEAIKFYRSYLRKQPDAPNRGEVEKKIEELKALQDAKKAATQGAPLSVLPPGAGEDRAAKNPPPAPTPAPAPAPRADPVPSVIAPATTAPVPLPEPPPVPAPAPAVDLTVSASAQPATDERPPIYKTWWFWTAAGAVTVAVVVGIAFGLSGGVAGAPDSALGNRKVF